MSSSNTSRVATALNVASVLLVLLILTPLAAFVYFRFFFEPQLEPRLAARYAAEAQERLAENAEEIQEEVVALAGDTLPPISTAIQQEAQEDYVLYLHALGQEGDEYLASIDEIVKSEVKQQYREYLRRHVGLLKEEFPEHASEENVQQVLADFEQTFDKLVERYYLDEFHRQSQRTASLWQQLEPVEAPGPGEPPLDEQLADYLADWAVLSATQEASAALASGGE